MTKQSAYPFPRTIDPSLIELGDTIKVTHKQDKGVSVSVSGTVASRADHGDTRYLYTEEGGTLLAWDAKRKLVSVMLLHRPEAAQTPLSMFEDVLERTG